eukprot:89381-Amphidinium_carterae.1
MSLDMFAAVCLGGGGFGGPGTGTYQFSKLGSVVTWKSTLTMRSSSDLPTPLQYQEALLQLLVLVDVSRRFSVV